MVQLVGSPSFGLHHLCVERVKNERSSAHWLSGNLTSKCYGVFLRAGQQNHANATLRRKLLSTIMRSLYHSGYNTNFIFNVPWSSTDHAAHQYIVAPVSMAQSVETHCFPEIK